MVQKKINRIRSGLWDRRFTMTKRAVSSGASLAAHSLITVFSSQESKDEGFKRFLTSQAAALAQELGQLKGSLMKMGQMLALFGEHYFPKEVVAILKTLNEDSSPLPWQQMEPILRRRLKPEQLAALEIEQSPLAAASLGQVYLATIKETGEKVCIKVQYPGVAEAIDSDLKSLKSVLSMFKLVPKHKQGFDELMKEIKSMLVNETDYNRERLATESMTEMLANQPGYRVPKTHPQFSGAKILTTTYEPGVNIDSIEVKELSEERRASIGSRYAKLFLDELFVYRYVQTDPHFGNYKINLSDEDCLILLDFGALRKFSKKFIKGYHQMLFGAINDDYDKAVEGAIKVGFLTNEDNEKQRQCFLDLAMTAIEPWLPADDPRANLAFRDDNGHYLWSLSDTPNLLTKQATDYAFNFKLRPPPKEVVFLDRKIGGVFIVLKKLDARFNAATLMKEYADLTY